MAVITELRAYGDESGKEDDPQHKVMTVALHLSELDRWRVFEREWREVLGDNHVPYLHMKEWWNRDDEIYKHLKTAPEKEATFFRDLAGVIARNIRYCASSIVRLPDLKQFNQDYGLKIGGYPLALYGCLIELRKECRDEDISIIVDKVPRGDVDCAKRYAETDTWEDLKSSGLPIMPLEKSDSFKTVLPIQAADWWAWEVRKNEVDRLGWDISEEDRANLVSVYRAYSAWKPEFEAEHGREPRERKSAWSLYKAIPSSGVSWDYANMKAGLKNRHKNGWT
jgi:hypothetical protein